MAAPDLLIAPRLGCWRESGLEAEDLDRRLPSLARLLRFSRPVASKPRGLDAMLLQALDLPLSGLPWAQSIAHDEGQSAPDGTLLCHRLMHIRADISNALAIPVEVGDEEKTRIYKDLNNEFKEDCRFFERSNGDGLLSLNKPLAPEGLPHVNDLMGQPLSGWYDRLRDQPEWYRLHNELQMFLHLHPVNQFRQQQGRAPINGLWCWGSEAIPAEPAAFDAQADHDDLQAVLEHCARGQGETKAPRLRVWTAWLRALQGGESVDSVQALKQLERWAAQLLQRGRGFRLLTGDGVDFVHRPLQRLYFWRPRFDWQGLEAAS